MESDDLVGITDLSHINNQRVITQAIEAFRKIMSKKHEYEENGETVYPEFENPLLPGNVPDEYVAFQTIDSRETVFAIFYKMVDDALEPYLKFVKENLLDNAKKHAAQKMEEFAEKKNELIELYKDHCTYFTQSFNNPEL